MVGVKARKQQKKNKDLKIILSRLAGLPVLFGGEPAEYKVLKTIVEGSDYSQFEFKFKPTNPVKRFF